MNKTGLYWLLLSLVIFCVDAVSKNWIKKNFLIGEIVPIGKYLNVYTTLNFGVAWGFLAYCNGYYRVFFSFIAINIISFLYLEMSKLNFYQYYVNIPYAMIIGGTLGNLFDRIMYGMVIDFIDLYIGNFHLPTFNIADLSILVGVLVNVFLTIYLHNKKN